MPCCFESSKVKTQTIRVWSEEVLIEKAIKKMEALLVLQIHLKKVQSPALAGVAQWIECWPVKQRVASLIPSLGHKPGLWARSPLGLSLIHI